MVLLSKLNDNLTYIIIMHLLNTSCINSTLFLFYAYTLIGTSTLDILFMQGPCFQLMPYSSQYLCIHLLTFSRLMGICMLRYLCICYDICLILVLVMTQLLMNGSLSIRYMCNSPQCQMIYDIYTVSLSCMMMMLMMAYMSEYDSWGICECSSSLYCLFIICTNYYSILSIMFMLMVYDLYCMSS